jgi:hypothetical protein
MFRNTTDNDHIRGSIDHLARTLFISREWRELVMAFLTVYFDRSADSANTVVAGYVSKAGDWVEFQHAWQAWLHKYDVPYFHMKEFAHSVKAYAQGWSGQHRKRREFITGLIQIIQAHTYHSFSAGVRHEDFDAVITTSPEAVELFGNYYTLCARACGRDVRKWQADNFPNSPIDYIFESGDDGVGLLIQIMKRDGFPIPVFKPKAAVQTDPITVFTPFQAADFLAWESRKSMGQVDAGIEWDDLRESMKALSFGIGSWSHHTKENLLETLTLHGV